MTAFRDDKPSHEVAADLDEARRLEHRAEELANEVDAMEREFAEEDRRDKEREKTWDAVDVGLRWAVGIVIVFVVLFVLVQKAFA